MVCWPLGTCARALRIQCTRQHFWNWHRPHTALGGRSPIDRVCELMAITPSAEAVDAAYNPAKERIRVPSYVTDTTLARVK